ncbi:dihydrofolate reductase family protein [Desulfovibrio sp. OttesenSCG-928-I05]|nr:dihydrofolate reductase family protein [Desulfovibrio sp. OttesenSCG-928-I05]
MSGKLILYVACSVDGYIAESDGSIGFLEESPTPLSDLGYEAFYASVDTLIMGGTTYRQIADELSPEKWLYEGKNTYIYTRHPFKEKQGIKLADAPPKELLEKIRSDTTGDIWLVGGGEIVKMFMEENLVDRYMLYIMPNVLGNGIPLFPQGFPASRVALERVQNINDVVEIIYNKLP